jgi:DNA-directed RNA polymerase specialized sigma subunit
MKLSLLNKGKKISEEHKKKLSHLFSGKGNPMYGKNKGGIEHPFYGKTHSIETKKKIAKINQSLSEEKINEIRWLYSEGVKQIDIANKFGISRASVCRIVNNKRYIL